VPLPAPTEIKTLPAYALADVARFVGVSEQTMRAWFRGRPPVSSKKGGFRRAAVKPILPTDSDAREPLSFLDLIEAHMLFSLRNAYKFPMRKVRIAAEYLASLEGSLTLLAHKDFFHDHGDLYLGEDEKLLSLTERGQLADKTILESGLHQVTYGKDGYADEFFPNGATGKPQREFVVNPSINFGRLSVVRLRVGADALAERYAAGEKMADIAEDYGATTEEIVEAIRWHDRLAA
jgi:uncharacterized protein (DUF433 family)